MTIGNSNERTLWEGQSQTLTGAATGGKLSSTRYRVTPEHLYIEKGVVRTDSQQIPLVAVHDVDVMQSMTQKARGIGDVTVHVAHAGGREVVTLEAVKEPKQVRDIVNRAAADARAHAAGLHRAQVNVQSAAIPATTPAPPASGGSGGSGGSVIEQLKELAALRAAGVLTAEEFAAQKAKLLT